MRIGSHPLLALLCALLLGSVAPPSPQISVPIGEDLIRLRFDPWFAGAVSGLDYRGKSYVNAADHGRLIQSALSLDGWGECLNPTEAGSVADGRQRRTTSLLLSSQARGRDWRSRTQMAYWMPPGAPHRVNPTDLQVHTTPQPCSADKAHSAVTSAVNRVALSGVVLDKKISIGTPLPNMLRFQLSFELPRPHDQAMFEALTVYLEPGFNRFHALEPGGRLSPIRPVHSGKRPLIASTADGRHAMGFVSRDPGMEIGAFRWPDTSKLNCFMPKAPVKAGKHRFECLIAIGTLAEVRASLAKFTLN